jgi:hypothetical protein
MVVFAGKWGYVRRSNTVDNNVLPGKGLVPSMKKSSLLPKSLSSIFLSKGLAPAVMFGIFLYSILYRLGLFCTIYQNSQKLGFVVLGFGTGAGIMYLGTLFKDGIIAAAFGGVVWGLQRLAAPLSLRCPRAAKSVTYGVTWLILLVVSTTFTIHWEMLLQMGAAPTAALISYALENSSVFEFLSYGSLVDAFLVFMVVPAFLVQLVLPENPRAIVRKGSALIFVASFAAFFFSYLRPWEGPGDDRKNAFMPAHTTTVLAGRFDPAVTVNPLAHLLKSVIQAPHNSFRAFEKLPSAEQQSTPAFLDPAFATARPLSHRASPPGGRKQWNVVIVQMEGVNQDHAFAHDPVTGPAMPFVSDLATRSLVLRRHFATAVDTEVSVFSLFTGLFPITQPIKFVLRPDLQLPTVFSILSGTHDRFLVAASSLQKWYPVGLLRNSGLQEIWDVDNSPSGKYYVGFMSFKDERETAKLFIERVRRAGKPFIGVYCPYATHFPYVAPGMPKETAEGPKRDRYMYTLRLVDSQIKRVFDALKSERLLDSTIFVVTADHGEAFGEHGTWSHGTNLLNTAANVPFLFYQPRLFHAENNWQVTSHVDFLPTLLDVMGVDYSERQFEGESILRAQRRKYAFIYTPRSDQLGSVSNDGIKLVVDYRSDTCTAYDITSDFDEQNRLNCNDFPAQLGALSIFRRYHTTMLAAYSRGRQK